MGGEGGSDTKGENPIVNSTVRTLIAIDLRPGESGHVGDISDNPNGVYSTVIGELRAIIGEACGEFQTTGDTQTTAQELIEKEYLTRRRVENSAF